jgi:hypothetical protein
VEPDERMGRTSGGRASAPAEDSVFEIAPIVGDVAIICVAPFCSNLPFQLPSSEMSLPIEISLLMQSQLQTLEILDSSQEEFVPPQDQDPDWTGMDEDDLDEALYHSGLSLFALLKQRNTPFLLTSFLDSLGSNKRGPYNQDFVKSFEYFDQSLAWPDAMFRHEYR